MQHTRNNIRRFIEKEIVNEIKTPKLIITDGGPNIVANATNAWLDKQGISQKVTTPYHSQANGRIDRLNRSLTMALEKLNANNARA